MAAARAAAPGGWSLRASRFLYAPEGDAVKDEDAPAFTDAPSRSARPCGADGHGAPGHRGARHRGRGAPLRLVLRPGHLLRRRRRQRRRGAPAAPAGAWATAAGVFSFIHVDDAAAATVAAVEGGPPGIFNVVDDEPAPARELAARLRRGPRRRGGHGACRAGSRAGRAEDAGGDGHDRCAAPPTPGSRRSSAGSPATRAGGRASAMSCADRQRSPVARRRPP